MSDRATLAARIRALKAKTVENGCTEAEALAAAEMLASLLEKYNMTLDEAEMRASPFAHHNERHEDAAGERLWKVAAAITDLVGSRYWQSNVGVFPIEINFFGFAHEVEVSAYMLEICARAMRGEQERLKRLAWPRALRRRQLIPVMDGMADRLAERIREMKPPKPTGTGLVVLHGALIDKEMQDRRLRTKKTKARSGRDWDPNYDAGRAAADQVALNPGVSTRPASQGLLR